MMVDTYGELEKLHLGKRKFFVVNLENITGAKTARIRRKPIIVYIN